MAAQRATTIEAGTVLPARELTSITGVTVPVPDPGAVVHLQFRRFAGCPVCTLHLRSFVRRHDEVGTAGVREVVLFHSTADDLRRYAGDLPFAVVADPGKRLYRAFGVESSPRALLHPRAWWPILRAVAHSLSAIVRRRGAVPPLFPPGGRYGLPADFLVDRDGRVLASHYGTHADDQWSVDEVISLARSHRRDPVPA
ncbi:MAG TPA: peroxiredoxin-like family protein [Acidimicrobiales bacterium]|nr:peroxiredoxin-like family protein [Acidimicrobiales bacterium]